jgi:hypothetical protein
MPNASQRNPAFSIPAEPMVDLYDRPGVMYREDNVPGAASKLYMPPERILRARKGDLGMEHIPNFEPRPNSSGKSPFKNLKRGK